MDPLTRGQIFHAAQARLHRMLHGQRKLPVTKPNLSPVLDELDRILASMKAEFADRLAPAIRQIWDAEWDAIRADLRGWLLYKAEYETDWTPESFEWSFGLKPSPDRDPHSVAEPVQVAGEYSVTGAIDMIERGPEGVLRVVDHKTGKPPKDPVVSIGGGEKLQPALYAMALQQQCNQRVQGGRLFYSTLRGNYKIFDVPLSDSTRNAVEEFYGTLDHFVKKGFLPAAPREGACNTCDYQPVCGPWEEERTKKKPQTDLRKLSEIRELP
jgi:CRISPR/Cas system-associated exonuclease Cas4 (RecB family)